MSADNGIYYAEFPDGYRVIHAQAIDNLEYYPEGSPEYFQQIKNYFGGAKAVPESELWNELKRVSELFPNTEYGIQKLGSLSFEETNDV